LICDGSINKQQLAGVSFSNFRGGQFFDSNQQEPPWLFNGNSPPWLGPGAMNLQHLQSVEEVVSEEWIIYMILQGSYDISRLNPHTEDMFKETCKTQT